MITKIWGAKFLNKNTIRGFFRDFFIIRFHFCFKKLIITIFLYMDTGCHYVVTLKFLKTFNNVSIIAKI
jgi:hypothetical protein